MVQYTSSPGAYDQRGKQIYVLRTRIQKRGARKGAIPFNEHILQGFKKMDEDIQRIMCASQGDITEATAQEYNKNQEVVRQAS